MSNLPPASALFGPNPRGAARDVSLAVRTALQPVMHEGGDLLIGLSGGADSTALALAAIDCAGRAGMRVHTLTVDHGLRAESQEEAARVRARATSWGAVASSVRVDISRDAGPEGGARLARREALKAASRDLGGCPILLGHTLDDQAETVLLRLARGSGAHSLRAMSPQVHDDDGTLWLRPLLSVRRATLRQALVDLGVEWEDDPSNAVDGPWHSADGSPLRRAAVREWALPALERALGMDPAPALVRSAALLAEDDDALEEVARTALGEIETCDGALSFLVGPLTLLPKGVLRRSVRQALLHGGARPGDLTFAHIEAVCGLITHWRGQGPIHIPGLHIARKSSEAGPVMVMTTP
ncbi:MAG: tRNA lysidine(34) synthetase TilS [Actinomycetaceae bacterium]|nr:tRNA lysidine(34) synthetase TilS [Actinomycetaceae bacterium]